jgi:hypothetical protein
MRKFYVPLVSLFVSCRCQERLEPVRNDQEWSGLLYALKRATIWRNLWILFSPISLGKVVKLRHKRNNFALWTSYCNFYRLLISPTYYENSYLFENISLYLHMFYIGFTFTFFYWSRTGSLLVHVRFSKCVLARIVVTFEVVSFFLTKMVFRKHIVTNLKWGLMCVTYIGHCFSYHLLQGNSYYYLV